MAKVSIGLRGWRFDEEAVFAEDGRLRPLEEMPGDAGTRVSRLSALVGSPCDACWLIHGDEDLPSCNVAAVVYGEPLSEVVLCAEHERDFVYWFREAGGDAHRGEPELQDAFHEWFAAGNRAPEDYPGIEHVQTAPEELPEVPDDDTIDVELPDDRKERIDLREGEVHTGPAAEADDAAADSGGDTEDRDADDDDQDGPDPQDTAQDDPGSDDPDPDDADEVGLDLSRDYPT